jgi:hypothetical protein
LVELQIFTKFEVVSIAIGHVAWPRFLCPMEHGEGVRLPMAITENSGLSFRSSVAKRRAFGQKSMNEMNRHCALADR